MIKTTYIPSTFRDIFESPIGTDLWGYLNTDKVWDRLELTTYLKHPAAEGVGDLLLETFPKDFSSTNKNRDRLKQAAGHMIRQIMEANGYEMDKPKVKCHINKLFVYAARYRKTKDSTLSTKMAPEELVGVDKKPPENPKKSESVKNR